MQELNSIVSFVDYLMEEAKKNSKSSSTFSNQKDKRKDNLSIHQKDRRKENLHSIFDLAHKKYPDLDPDIAAFYYLDDRLQQLEKISKKVKSNVIELTQFYTLIKDKFVEFDAYRKQNDIHDHEFKELLNRLYYKFTGENLSDKDIRSKIQKPKLNSDGYLTKNEFDSLRPSEYPINSLLNPKSNNKNSDTIHEGGNVFKHSEYTKDNRRMLTRRINKSEVPQVVEHLTDLVGFNVSKHLLGSTGVAETSGDIDVAVDANKFSKDSIIAKLLSHDVTSESISKSGSSVHYKAPIGDTGDFVQVDFMLVPDVEFARWSMHAQPRNSSYRGADWQRVMNDVARGTDSNWKWSTFEGVLTRDTNENVFGRNPVKIVAGLFGEGTVPQDIHSVEQILELIPLNHNYKIIQPLIAKTLSGDLRVPQIKESVTDKYINNLSKWINEISTSKRT
jgi:hypothetical protein